MSSFTWMQLKRLLQVRKVNKLMALSLLIYKRRLKIDESIELIDQASILFDKSG
jgi:hypothetical protein